MKTTRRQWWWRVQIKPLAYPMAEGKLDTGSRVNSFSHAILSSTDVTILLLNQPNISVKPPCKGTHSVQTPHYHGQFSLSLRKQSPYIFSKFNLLNTDTLLTQLLNRVWLYFHSLKIHFFLHNLKQLRKRQMVMKPVTLHIDRDKHVFFWHEKLTPLLSHIFLFRKKNLFPKILSSLHFLYKPF